MFSSRLTRFTVDHKLLLRSEILGIQFMYDILQYLSSSHFNREELMRTLENDFRTADDWEQIINKNVSLLQRLDAIRESITLGNLFLTNFGKDWTDLLTEINIEPKPQKPLTLIMEDIPGNFLRLLKQRAEDVARIIIISPWISERKLAHRISEIIRQFSISTYVITRTPDDEINQESLSHLKSAGSTISINDSVHAKIYVCETKPEKVHNSFAIVGSANLTRSARFHNIEVGVLIRGITDRYLTLIQHLIQSTYDLKGKEW